MTLDSLPRQEMIKVIDNMRYYLGMDSAAKRKIYEVNQLYSNGYAKLKKREKTRNIIVLLVCLLAFPTFFVSAFAVTSYVSSGYSDNYAKVGIQGLIFVIGVVIAVIVLLIILKQKKKKDIIQHEKFCSGIYAYIPCCEKISKENIQMARTLQARYNVHNSLFSLEALSYVRELLVSNSSISVYSAMQSYQQYLHNERMYNEAQRQTSKLEQIRRDNQVFYDNALGKLDDIIALERQQTEALNYIAYWW